VKGAVKILLISFTNNVLSFINFSLDVNSNIINVMNRGLFQQVLINILKNGIEAMPNGGELTITCFQKDSTIKITIKDEGIGMNEEQKNRLGEPYFSSKDTKGTGLGMMVVYRIVETMKGKVSVTSEQGKGTSITLLFPTNIEKAINK
jgi:two-component system, sporulation sensor kinase B